MALSSRFNVIDHLEVLMPVLALASVL